MFPATATGSYLHSIRAGMLLAWIDIKQGIRKHIAGNTVRDRILQIGGLTFAIVFLAALHGVAIALIAYAGVDSYYADTHMTGTQFRDLFRGLSTSVWSFLLFVMLSGGLVRALVVLHEQDDSNLLLASPTSPRAILAARLFGNALQSCVVDGFIIVPWINVLAVFGAGHLVFLWGYPVWFALAVIVTCLDGLFSFGLIHFLGLRRARLFSQAVPFILVLGVTLFAGLTSVSVVTMNFHDSGTHMPLAMANRFIALSHTPLVWIARAAAGNGVGLTIIFYIASVLAVTTLYLTERAFVEGTQNLSESTGPATRAGSVDAPFRRSLLYLEVLKNLRLIVRTPMMMVQCLAQALMPVGIACVLGRQDIAAAISFFIIFATGVLSGMFTIAAGTVEECDDLLNMSPRNARLFRYGKMLSGCFWPIVGALVVIAGFVITGHELLAGAVLFGGIPLGLAASIVGETFATPARPGVRPKLLADPIMMIPFLGLSITSGAIAGATTFAALISPFFLAAAVLSSYLICVIAIGLAQLRKPLF